MVLGFLGLGQLIEDGAVLDHGCAKLLGSGFNLAERDGDGVGGTVVFHDAGIGDGEVGGSLLEADLGVAAGFKEGVDEVVGLSDRGAGVIDEAGLDGVPLGDETLALGDAEVADIKGFDAGFAVVEFGFGGAGSAGEDGAVVLGSEAVAEGPGAGTAVLDVSGYGNDDEKNQDQCGDEKLGVGDMGENSVDITLHGDLLWGEISAVAWAAA